MKFANLYVDSELSRCLMCYDAPCAKACPNVEIDRGLRALFFKNDGRAASVFASAECEECEKKPCLKACTRARSDKAIDIPFIASYAQRSLKSSSKSISLQVDFCGFKCENPFVLASSVIANNYEMCANALRAGWGGVCVKTISYNTINEVSPRFDVSAKNAANFAGFKNLEQLSEKSIEENMLWIKRLKEEFPTKLIMVSIMGSNEQEWESLAKISTLNGADIIECNFSCPQMTYEGMGSDVGANNELVELYTAACRRGTDLPILAKLSPNITKADGFVEAALKGGANGVAAINTIKSIATVDFAHSTHGGNGGLGAISGYSGRAVKPIALRFIKEISENCDTISGIGGVYTWRDALDFIMLGSGNIQICTAVMEYGYRIIDDLREGLSDYLAENNYHSLDEVIGVAKPKFVSPNNLERGKIIKPLVNEELCIGCGRCYISCRDGGHQAIEFKKNRRPQILDNCVGCHLCKLVCPTGAIFAANHPTKNQIHICYQEGI